MRHHHSFQTLVFPLRTSRLWGAVLAGVVALGLGGCPETPAPAQPCSSDLDCPGRQTCVDGQCAESSLPANTDGGPPPGRDAGALDGGALDGGALDGGPLDGGTFDAGALDAGTDAGALDAGALDAGTDAGGVDAGGDRDAGTDSLFGLRVAQITIAAEENAIAADDVVRLVFNHRALVIDDVASASGNDLHFYRGQQRLPRALAPTSAWNQIETEVWFRASANISPSEAVTIDVFVNPDLAPIGNLVDIATAGDDFEGGGLHPSLALSVNGDVTTGEEGGRYYVQMSDDEAEAAIVAGAEPLPGDRRFFLQHRMETSRVIGGGDFNVKTIGIVQWPTRPTFAPTNNLGENIRQRVVLNQGDPNSSGSVAYYKNADGDLVSWIDGEFIRGYDPWTYLPFGVDYIYEIESDSAAVVMRVKTLDGDVALETTPIPWAEIQNVTADVGDDPSNGPFWFYWGEVYTYGEPGGTSGPFYAGDFSSEWFFQLRPLPTDSRVEYSRTP